VWLECGEIALLDGELELVLVGVGVDAFDLSRAVKLPVLVEVAVADDRSEGEDGFGAGDAPP
jgi:hypothetical protein